MKKILIISSRKITSKEVLQELQDFYQKFEIVHLFLEEGLPETLIESGVKGVIFNADTDYFEINSIINKIPIGIQKLRVYSSFRGFVKAKEYPVFITHETASDFLYRKLNH